eukprot:1487736-Alexandrium_andersonii.AAC.1
MKPMKWPPSFRPSRRPRGIWKTSRLGRSSPRVGRPTLRPYLGPVGGLTASAFWRHVKPCACVWPS